MVYDDLDQPAVLRRARAPSPPAFAENGEPVGDLGDSSLHTLVCMLATCDAANVPQDLLDLEQAGLPPQWSERLRQFVADGHAPADVVRALLEAIGIGAMRDWLPVPLPRNIARVLRHSFASTDECAALRAQMEELVRVHAGGAPFAETAPRSP